MESNTKESSQEVKDKEKPICGCLRPKAYACAVEQGLTTLVTCPCPCHKR